MNETMDVQYLGSNTELVEAGARLIVQSMVSAVEQRGRFIVALSGGNTPKPIYARLAQPPYGRDLPWEQVEVWFGDERMVPCDNPESNFHMACEALLDHVSISPWNVHRVEGQDQPEHAAFLYNRQLLGLAGNEPLPRFDLMLLGLGPDGHTASLFPGTEVLENTTDLAAAVSLPADSQGVQHAQDRVTLTYPVINNAREIVFLVSGADKQDALERVARGDESAPAARVRPADGTIRWLVVKP